MKTQDLPTAEGRGVVRPNEAEGTSISTECANDYWNATDISQARCAVIFTSKGEPILVDPEHRPQLMRFPWRLTASGYAVTDVSDSDREGKRVMVRMHRMILGLSSQDQRLVDHANGNPSDNRSANLRICTHAENTRNSKKSSKKQGYKGVTKKHNRFSAGITVDGKHIHLGTFDTAEEAFSVYCSAADKYHREFANYGLEPGQIAPERNPNFKLPHEIRCEKYAFQNIPNVFEVSVGETIEAVEIRLIQATMLHFGGVQYKAAEALGISLKTLYNKLKKATWRKNGQEFSGGEDSQILVFHVADDSAGNSDLPIVPR